MWHAFSETRGLRPPSVHPNHPAAPYRRRAPRDVLFRPGAKVSRSQTDLLTPWHDGRAGIIPFRYLPVLLRGKGTSHVGWDTGDLPCQGRKLRVSNPTRPRFQNPRMQTKMNQKGALVNFCLPFGNWTVKLGDKACMRSKITGVSWL